MITWQLKINFKNNKKLLFFPSLKELSYYLSLNKKNIKDYQIEKIVISDQIDLAKKLNAINNKN